MNWAQIDDGRGIRTTHAPPGFPLAARVTYLEGWAVRAIMAGHAARCALGSCRGGCRPRASTARCCACR